MTKFIKQLASTVFFIAGLLLLLTMVSSVLVPKSDDAASAQDPAANGILSEPKNTIDTLIIGDSEIYSSLNPLQLWQQYGLTAYNCGTSAQTLPYSKTFVEKAFENQSPKVVILETNAIFRNFSIQNAFSWKLDRILPIFTYHNRWKALGNSDSSASMETTYSPKTKGYLFNTSVDPANTDGYMKPTSDLASISERNVDYVKSIKEYCEARGAKLVLVSTPSTVNWKSARHNSIDQLAKSLQLDYIDMNLMPKEIPIDWNKDTRDKGDHMNYHGAQKVTAYIGQWLSEKTTLQPHIGDIAYANWDQLVATFQKNVTAMVKK